MKPEKHLIITMPDGTEWKVPLHIVVEHRKNHWLKRENLTVLEADDQELLGWASEYMSWDDINPFAELVEPSLQPPDYVKLYAESRKTIV